MKDHALRHSRFRDFSCSLCGKTFKTKFDLKSHNYHVHSNLKKFECKICKRKFKSKWYLNEHELAHTVEFECGECLKIFKTSRHFKRHMERNKGSKIIQCPRCDRNFHRQGDLNSHLKQVHKSERNFECEICKKAFKSKGKVKEHQIMHSDVKSFKCGNCGIAFKRKFQLNKHSLIHRD
jgi:KRAB domain-containing zinc finger protein